MALLFTAARVHVTSYRVENCNHVYSVTVKEQFNLRTPYNSSYFTTAPALARDEEITVVISPSHCDKCPELSLDQEYIIGGDYIRNDGNVEWHLVGSSNKALAGIWKSKYNSRMAKWIEDGNNSSDRLQCQQCE